MSAGQLETLWLEVPERAVPAYEAALRSACASVAFFRDEDSGLWRVEGVREPSGIEALAGPLALAEAATGVAAVLSRVDLPAAGWLARAAADFPAQLIGRRFAVRGTHLPSAAACGRIVLTLDAGLAFGSGEHGSTRGCLRALERLACRRPRRALDVGTGSGILAIAAAKLLRRRILAIDIDSWSVRIAAQNAALNHVAPLVSVRRANGLRAAATGRGAPFDLVFANILARPLCAMAASLSRRLAHGGVAVLSGLLVSQRRQVLAAYRRRGLPLAFALREGDWSTLAVCRSGRP